MTRELPMFQPPADGGHVHAFEPPSIAMAGLVAPDAPGPGGPHAPLTGGVGGAAGTAPVMPAGPNGRTAVPHRHPDWIRARIPTGETYVGLKELLRGLSLHTVCEEARCPNIGECWDQRTATVMILGDVCTRACGFCAIRTGRPTWNDPDEPRRVAEAVAQMDLDHVVVTSVARDDLPDGGAGAFAATIRQLRATCPGMGVEVLIPDFNGEEAPLRTVMQAAPDILNHNLETVERLQKPVRRRARYDRSLGVLERARAYARQIAGRDGTVHTKSSIMVGLGEEHAELLQAFRDLRAVDCDILTLGQYLRPSEQHLPVERYYTPQEFVDLRAEAVALGFRHVESGPLVRSSYHARNQVPDAERRALERAALRAAAAAGGATLDG